jgi:hypothetical protein
MGKHHQESFPKDKARQASQPLALFIVISMWPMATSSTRFPCLKFTGRNTNLQPRFLCSDSRTVRTVTTINAVRILEKCAQKFNAAVRRPYDLYGSINAACSLDLHAAVRSEQVQQSRPYQIRTVRIFPCC